MTKHKNLFQKIVHARFYVILVCIYVFFLATLPSLNNLLTPCLKPLPAASYSDGACNVGVALDHFMLASMTGLGVMILYFYLKRGRGKLKHVIVFAVMLTSLTIGAYYMYIPEVEMRIKAAPIVLESFIK